MASATLSSAGSLSNDFDTTAGAVYAIGGTGVFGGGIVTLFASLPTSPTVFFPLQSGDFMQPFAREIRAPGTKLRFALTNPNRTATSSVNAEVTAAV